MSVDTLIFEALKGLVGDRVFPDIAPEKTPRPYITYQQVGGASVNFTDCTVPSKKNARYQINVWGNKRADVAVLAGQVEDLLRLVTELQTIVLGAPISIYEPETTLRGTRQDFSFWN